MTRTQDGEVLELYQNSWAVVIGINQYRKWPSLQYAVNDARAVRDQLTRLELPPKHHLPDRRPAGGPYRAGGWE